MSMLTTVSYGPLELLEVDTILAAKKLTTISRYHPRKNSHKGKEIYHQCCLLYKENFDR